MLLLGWQLREVCKCLGTEVFSLVKLTVCTVQISSSKNPSTIRQRWKRINKREEEKEWWFLRAKLQHGSICMQANLYLPENCWATPVCQQCLALSMFIKYLNISFFLSHNICWLWKWTENEFPFLQQDSRGNSGPIIYSHLWKSRGFSYLREK